MRSFTVFSNAHHHTRCVYVNIVSLSIVPQPPPPNHICHLNAFVSSRLFLQSISGHSHDTTQWMHTVHIHVFFVVCCTAFFRLMVFVFISIAFSFLTFASFVDSSNWNLFTQSCFWKPRTRCRRKKKLFRQTHKKEKQQKKREIAQTYSHAQMYCLCIYWFNIWIRKIDFARALVCAFILDLILLVFSTQIWSIKMQTVVIKIKTNQPTDNRAHVCTVNNRLQYYNHIIHMVYAIFWIELKPKTIRQWWCLKISMSPQ